MSAVTFARTAARKPLLESGVPLLTFAKVNHTNLPTWLLQQPTEEEEEKGGRERVSAVVSGWGFWGSGGLKT